MQVRSNEATLPVVPLHGEFALTFSVISLRNCQFSWMSFAFTLPIQEGNYHVFDWNLFHFSVSSFQIWNYKNHSVNIYSFKLLSIFMFQKSHSFLMEEKVSLEICLLSSFSVLFFFFFLKNHFQRLLISWGQFLNLSTVTNNWLFWLSLALEKR